MADLRPDARALIRAGRTAFRPQPSDRERVLQSLTQALGESASVGAAHRTQPPASVVGQSAVRSWVLGGLGALAVSAGIVVATHPWTRATTASSPTSTPMATPIPASEPAFSTAIPSLSAEDLPLQRRVEGLPRSQRPGPQLSIARQPLSAHAVLADSLPEEVSLLSKAEQQLNAGRVDEALRTLGEHERRFPSGALAEERLAARVQSLCALGRVGEARTELAKLARTYPGSAHFDRARRFCGIGTP
jgi:hypothetical protein